MNRPICQWCLVEGITGRAKETSEEAEQQPTPQDPVVALETEGTFFRHS